MFVNFAKEQTDEDQLTDVVISNPSSQVNTTPGATTANTPTIQPQNDPATPPQQPKTPQEPVKPPDSKDGKSKKSKSGKVKSKKGKPSGEKGSSTALNMLPQGEKVERRGSSGANGSNVEGQGEGSTNKSRMEDPCKHPSALFIVNSDTQDSSLWGELVPDALIGPKTV